MTHRNNITRRQILKGKTGTDASERVPERDVSVPAFPPNPRNNITRRQILKAGVLSVAAAIPGISGAAEDNPYGKLNVGVHTYSLRKFSLADAVRITQEFGVQHIGLNPVHLALDSTPEERAAAKELIQDAGLTLHACGVIGFGRSKRRARLAFEYAKAMGMRTIVANPEDGALDVLDELVEEYGIRIAIHNHGPESHFSVPEDTLAAIKDHHRLIGACVDLGHYERSGVRAHEALDALRDRTYDVHLKDVNERTKNGHSVILGEGVVDWPAVAALLLEMNFDGHVALEYELESEAPEASMAKCFANFEEILKSLRSSQ